MTDPQASYRQIIKATSLFGGVQLFNILSIIIRSKFIAVLLGPTGMGIAGLLTATTGLIGAMTNFGLGTSAVKSVATANGTDDQNRIGIIIIVLRRLVWITGSLGMVITIIAAPLLSRFTFGNNDYTFAFIWISISLLITQLSSGQMVLLQGMRKLHSLAKANLAGSIFGLLTTIPLYYFLGLSGIVPAIIITPVIMLAGAWYFARKIKIPRVTVSRSTTIREGQDMLVLGFMISLSGLIGLGASYFVRIFISRTGGVEEVGLYIAGFAIINTYVGLIFAAMGTDYYPRLSALSNSNKLCKLAINQQAEVALLIMAPIIMLFLVFIQWVIVILYSGSFIGIYSMIQWAALGMFFKTASWSIAFLLLAKGASKLFFWNELLANFYILLFNLLGYHFMGLTGLGISFVLGYLIYLIQVFIICKIKYQFSFDYAFIRIFTIQFLMATSCFLLVNMGKEPYTYIFGIALILIASLYSYKELDKRIGLVDALAKLYGRIKKY